MPRFLYHAREGSGELSTGVVAALSVESAGQTLRAQGKYVVRLKEVAEEPTDPAVLSLQDHARRVRRADVVFFAHQMSVMIETGVPIAEALACVGDQAGNPSFRAVLQAVTEHVQAGGELSNALKKFPRAFPPIMVSLVRASEISGTMGTMLERVSRYLDKEERTRRQVRGALAYPLAMIVLALGVTAFLLAFVLPRFAKIYENRQAALPAPTRALMAVSSSLTDFWYLWLAAVVLLGTVALVVGQSSAGRRGADWLKLHCPILRQLFTQLYVSRACRAMGTMVTAGVSIIDTVAIARQVTDNHYFQRLWDQVDGALKQGLQLSDPLARSPLVPRSVTQMIRSGEKSGRLALVLERVAAHTEEEFDQTVRNTTQFIEPVMVLVMGGLIGFVAISLLLPIFSVSKVVAGS